MTFQKYCSNGNGKPKPGSLSRFAEALGAQYNTVRAWFYGEATPDEHWQKRLQNLVHARLDISRKSRADIGKKHIWKKKVSPRFSEVKPHRNGTAWKRNAK